MSMGAHPVHFHGTLQQWAIWHGTPRLFSSVPFSGLNPIVLSHYTLGANIFQRPSLNSLPSCPALTIRTLSPAIPGIFLNPVVDSGTISSLLPLAAYLLASPHTEWLSSAPLRITKWPQKYSPSAIDSVRVLEKNGMLSSVWKGNEVLDHFDFLWAPVLIGEIAALIKSRLFWADVNSTSLCLSYCCYQDSADIGHIAQAVCLYTPGIWKTRIY